MRRELRWAVVLTVPIALTVWLGTGGGSRDPLAVSRLDGVGFALPSSTAPGPSGPADGGVVGPIDAEVPGGFELGSWRGAPFLIGELTAAEARGRARGGAEAMIDPALLHAYEAVWHQPDEDSIVAVTVFELAGHDSALAFEALQAGDNDAVAEDLGGYAIDADGRINEARAALVVQPQATASSLTFVFGSRVVQVLGATSGDLHGQYVAGMIMDFGLRAYFEVMGDRWDEGEPPAVGAVRSVLPATRPLLEPSPRLEGLLALWPMILDPCALVPRAVVETILGPSVRARAIGQATEDGPVGAVCNYRPPEGSEGVVEVQVVTTEMFKGSDTARGYFDGYREHVPGDRPLPGVGEAAYTASTEHSTHAAGVAGNTTVVVITPARSGIGMESVVKLIRAARFPGT